MTAIQSSADNDSPVTGTEAASRAGSSVETMDDLRAQVDELRRTSQYRSLFLSRLAHELRTPLTSILGFSEILLSQEKLTEAQRGFCERIQGSAQQLQAHLNQLSDLAKLESGQAQRKQDHISIIETLHEILPTLSRAAQKKSVKFNWAAADDLPPLISDRARVRQLIFNGLAFAVSRSPENATIETRAEIVGSSFVIAITDNGDAIGDPSRIGILTADDKSSTGELGLSIARQSVELLGGSITARNLERGVELQIKLPLVSQDQPTR